MTATKLLKPAARVDDLTPSPEVLALAKRVCEIADELQKAREEVRQTQRQYQTLQRALSEDERLHTRATGDLGDRLTRIASLRHGIQETEARFLAAQSRVAPLEKELSELDDRLRKAIGSGVARRRAELSSRYRALALQLRDIRNEFFALGEVVGQIEHSGRACLPDLEPDNTDLLYQRDLQQPDVVRTLWPIKAALREAERALRG